MFQDYRFSIEKLESSDTSLMLAMATVGVPCNAEKPMIVTGEGVKNTFVWHFADKSICGKLKTSDLMRKWANPDYPKQGTPEEEEIWAYLKRYAQNRQISNRFIKGATPIAMIKGKGGKIGFIDLNIARDVEAKILARLGI